MSMFKPLIVVAALATLAACATVPQPLQGTYVTTTSAAAQAGGSEGAKVRWGGQIIKTEPGAQETCFYVLARPLDDAARPEPAAADGQTQGRFVTCHAGFYDPEVFTPGRELTVTGTLHGSMTQKVGDYDYAYPRVDADVVYLWPKRVNRYYGPYPYGYYDPFWGPYWGGPYWGGPWGGYWGGGVIVIHHRR